MNQDYKVTLRDIVELFYQSPFKIFNINSIDGETIIKPFGYFISLGITTSLDSLRLIRDYISKSDYGFESKIVEIKSIKSDKYGDYLNVLLPTRESEIKKYESEPPENIEILDKEGVSKLLRDIQSQIEKGDFRKSPLKQKINEILEKIGDDWDTKSVSMKDGVPGIFHKYVNYKKNEDSEYRIGIYATKS